ncbi:Glycosyltransferase family 61 protein [Candidatus Electrothrix aarhusensis]
MGENLVGLLIESVEMKNILSKILTLFVKINYWSVSSKHRFFVRFYYIGRYMQLKYFVKDYVLKPKYKIVSYDGEFSPELKFVLPFAYWHYLNGTLKETVSSKNTKELYFFSEKHTEKFNERVWCDFNYDLEIPNAEDHNIKYNFSKWALVPLKNKYQNTLFVFERPILIIANKYNTEWDDEPISYFSIEILRKLFDQLIGKYQILYNRPLAKFLINDNSNVLDLNEHCWIKKNYPSVILMDDLFEDNKSKFNNFNHFQLSVYANSDNFISTHGGTATLASYFCGTNLIFSVKGHEHFFNEYETIYPKLSNAKILVAQNESELMYKVNCFFDLGE